MVSLITEDFWDQGQFVAKSLGMPNVPRVKLPHPVPGVGEEKRKIIAASIIEDIKNRFANE